MKIKDFLESKIRNRILSKVNPLKINKKGKHWKGYIYLDNILIGKVKIPNDHNRVMRENKSRFIARDLKLNSIQFNQLIDCPLSGNDYYKILKKYL